MIQARPSHPGPRPSSALCFVTLAHFTVCIFICAIQLVVNHVSKILKLCLSVCICFMLHMCCIIVNTVGWTWCDWSLILITYLPSLLWHCWLGHKNPSPIWPVFGLTLNLAPSKTKTFVRCPQGFSVQTPLVIEDIKTTCQYITARDSF